MIWWKPTNNYLEHHGILGMKWGVRRYQNPDGSLTAAGKKRYGEIYSQHSNADIRAKNIQDQKTAAGVKSIDDNTDILKKGSSIYRMSSRSNESVSDRRKYASIILSDREMYKQLGREGGIGGTRTRFQTEYTAAKDIRIATAKNVADHIMQKHGNENIREVLNRKDIKASMGTSLYTFANRDLKKMTLRQLYDAIGNDLDTTKKTLSYHETHSKFKDTLTKEDRKLVSAVNMRVNMAKNLLNKSMHQYLFADTESKVFDEFKKKGYDAIVDTEDYGRLANYPLIFLNPQESMAKVNTTKFSKR